jgi:subtilisin family serine protease
MRNIALALFVAAAMAVAAHVGAPRFGPAERTKLSDKLIALAALDAYEQEHGYAGGKRGDSKQRDGVSYYPPSGRGSELRGNDSEPTIAVELSDGADPREFAKRNGLSYLSTIEPLGGAFHLFGFRGMRPHELGQAHRSKTHDHHQHQATDDAVGAESSSPSSSSSSAEPGVAKWSEIQRPLLRAPRAAPPRRARQGGDAGYGPALRSFDDPLYPAQWHLDAIDARGAWRQGYTGRGVAISIVDDGLEYSHPDLAENFYRDGSHDYNLGRSLPTPSLRDDHGTSAAGVAAAAANSVCGVGVAHSASVSGVRLIAASVTDATEASGIAHGTMMRESEGRGNDVVSCSWGPIDDGERLEGPGRLASLAMRNAATKGRRGLGAVFVWASGNGRSKRDSCSYDGYASSRFVVAVGAIASDGTQAWYSEGCAALMLVAPSSGGGAGRSISTTDLTGSRGSAAGDCTSTFGGTSAAAPMVAGAIALALEANGRMTRRDVQHVLVASASRSGLSPAARADPDWVRNSAGVLHSTKYGFGVVNASAAAALAARWTTVPPETSWESRERRVAEKLPASSTIEVPAGITVEWVEVTLSAAIKTRGDLRVSLVSPGGTESLLASEHDDRGSNYDEWTFSSCRHWGEQSGGAWTLTVSPTPRSVDRSAVFSSWKLALHGYRTSPATPAKDSTERYESYSSNHRRERPRTHDRTELEKRVGDAPAA